MPKHVRRCARLRIHRIPVERVTPLPRHCDKEGMQSVTSQPQSRQESVPFELPCPLPWLRPGWVVFASCAFATLPGQCPGWVFDYFACGRAAASPALATSRVGGYSPRPCLGGFRLGGWFSRSALCLASAPAECGLRDLVGGFSSLVSLLAPAEVLDSRASVGGFSLLLSLFPVVVLVQACI